LGLLTFTEKGIYCEQGDFYIDPYRPVNRAVITHAHADHARPGSSWYLCQENAYPVLQYRLGKAAKIATVPYREVRHVNGVRVSLHPAGHIIGSAQVRVEYRGEIGVVSGDYKIHEDGVTTPFEPVRCHTFITECTFGLPVYHWPDAARTVEQIREWWQSNQSAGKGSLLLAYSLGKAQRLLHAIGQDLGPVYTHGAIANVNQVFRDAGISLPEAPKLSSYTPKEHLRQALFLAPPSVQGSGWTKRFEPYSTAMASGWMMLRGTKRRKALDRGFVMSDHVDWEGLKRAVRETGASTIYTTHGYTDVFTRWLREQGYEAHALATSFNADGEHEAEAGEE